MEEKNIEIIKTTTEEVLKKMGFDLEVEIREDGDNNDKEDNPNENNIVCNVEVSSNSNFLIGQHGVNLQALQHIIRLIVRKRTEDKVNFIVDVNSYLDQKNKSIIEYAKETAIQASNEKKAIVMKPMSAYERRIVHMELSKNDKVVTESTGEGEARKVVVKPVSDIIN